MVVKDSLLELIEVEDGTAKKLYESVKNLFESKRNHEFQLLQEVAEAPKHRILKLAQTRWLSMEAVISRLIERWDALKLYFQSQSATDKVDGAGQLFQVMSTSGTKHMLLFLAFILKIVNTLNLEIQSETFRLHKVFASVRSEYTVLLSLYIKPSIMDTRDVSEIDPSDNPFQRPAGNASWWAVSSRTHSRSTGR
ncbi:Zinc finger protein 862 [Plakobranchus ocellatus]|uniref:Zinc finger protein 862 n=1 Tax=Plakobranchus ocellatus TaxID=259542 RepID=A0AAV3ZTL7_9GAST|nr:Zinc finger protein 862 [Plakobranchus ocellatus]